MLRLFKLIPLSLLYMAGMIFVIWLAGFLVFCGVISSIQKPANLSEIDAAIVLTGGSNRVDRGFDLLADGEVKHLLVSGVHKDVTFKDLLKLWGRKDKISRDRVTLGRKADNTIGNALEARSWIEKHDIRSVYVITSSYHVPRAMLEFRHILHNTMLIAYPVEPQNFSPLQPNYWRTAFIEYHKLLASLYRITLYPEQTQPVPPSLSEMQAHS